MKKYFVTFRVDARFTTEVDAETLKDAMEQARLNFSEANFGDAEDIDGDPVSVTDEDDNFVWEA